MVWKKVPRKPCAAASAPTCAASTAHSTKKWGGLDRERGGGIVWESLPTEVKAPHRAAQAREAKREYARAVARGRRERGGPKARASGFPTAVGSSHTLPPSRWVDPGARPTSPILLSWSCSDGLTRRRSAAEQGRRSCWLPSHGRQAPYPVDPTLRRAGLLGLEKSTQEAACGGVCADVRGFDRRLHKKSGVDWSQSAAGGSCGSPCRPR